MVEKYTIPNFKNLLPKSIQISTLNVEKSKYYNPEIEVKPSEDRFKNSFNKLLKGEYLVSRDYKILLFYLDEVERMYNFNRLYDSFYNRIDTFQSYRGFIRPIASYIYNYYDNIENIEKVYVLFRVIIEKLKYKDRYISIKTISKNNTKIKSFLYIIKSNFYNIETKSEIDDLLKKVFMSRNDKFYLKCMVKFIIKNYLDNKLIDEFIDIISRMDLATKKEVFVEILKIYSKKADINSYPVVWFDMISKYLGDPYGRINNKWSGIEDYLKETFRRWNNSKYLYEFFNKTVDGGDPERLKFWKQYIDSIYRIEYYEDLYNALVMEFENDVFIEFAEKGNALYIYKKDVRSIDDINKKINTDTITKKEKREYVKDRDLADTMHHRKEWQYRFEQQLRLLNYYKGGWRY